MKFVLRTGGMGAINEEMHLVLWLNSSTKNKSSPLHKIEKPPPFTHVHEYIAFIPVA